MTPQRIQMTRQRPWRADHPDAVIVDRRSAFGNPFVAGQQFVTVSALNDPEAEIHLLVIASREDAAGAFHEWLDGQWAVTDLADKRTWILGHLSELTGRDLACWCPLERGADGKHQCHADALLELANS